MPIACALPARIWPAIVPNGKKPNGTVPARKSGIAGGMPL
jgi:hypothetical protein